MHFGGLPAFFAEGLCAQTDPEVFFPEKGGATREAKKVCSECGVQPECLEWALSTGQRFGVWGGHSERERRAMSVDFQRGLFYKGGPMTRQKKADKNLASPEPQETAEETAEEDTREFEEAELAALLAPRERGVVRPEGR
jgi:WhiB family transcriptional regulator, redox-sensing transcriptional regulator